MDSLTAGLTDKHSEYNISDLHDFYKKENTPGKDVQQGKPPEVYGKKPPVKFAIFVNGKVCMSGTKLIRQLREDQMGSADSG